MHQSYLQEELEEVKPDLEGGQLIEKKKATRLESVLGVVFIKVFTLTFFAEWGDRSQIATIALAATKDPYGVTVGGVLGHSLCTAMAVIGGRMLATRISERTMLLSGGVVFLIFCLLDLMKGPE